MGYRVVDPDDVEPPADRPCEYRSLTEPADLDEMALNVFRAEPGEQVPLAYHYHETQEEAFFVLSGTLSVETPEGTFEVPAGNLFAVDPESPHRAHNPETADETVELLAVGAPPASDDAVAYEPGDPSSDPSEDD
ncbi:cupin domain-containing protein [Halobacterium bonnevillei]|uniref:Cupin domain-containing protein n=1 Tax=Halobacterium bonnevillei TaxID=2692200 RepID=A0A6B0SE28_9EURY|nr:cupin domain-containing protein [Halobacterium bonnevillei]MXR19177.1 cupin domain-containing protein [Halobacterium bonnevillei]